MKKQFIIVGLGWDRINNRKVFNLMNPYKGDEYYGFSDSTTYFDTFEEAEEEFISNTDFDYGEFTILTVYTRKD